MQITISRNSSGFRGQVFTSTGLCLLSVSSSTWFSAWMRLARVLSLLRVKYSLKLNF